MVKIFDCVKCGGHHARPINHNCKELKSADMEPERDTNSLILKELKTLSSMNDSNEKQSSVIGGKQISQYQC